MDYYLNRLIMFAGLFCNNATCYFILLTLDFVQGTNTTYVFTNISGHPVIYRPTGIYFYVSWSYCVLLGIKIRD